MTGSQCIASGYVIISHASSKIWPRRPEPYAPGVRKLSGLHACRPTFLGDGIPRPLSSIRIKACIPWSDRRCPLESFGINAPALVTFEF